MDDRRLVLRGARKAHPDHPPDGLEIVPGEAEYHRSTDEVEGAEWSGRDQRNRLVFASAGRIWARRTGKGVADVELADFSADRPDPQPAPAWATRPLLVSARNRSARGKKQKK